MLLPSSPLAVEKDDVDAKADCVVTVGTDGGVDCAAVVVADAVKFAFAIAVVVVGVVVFVAVAEVVAVVVDGFKSASRNAIDGLQLSMMVS